MSIIATAQRASSNILQITIQTFAPALRLVQEEWLDSCGYAGPTFVKRIVSAAIDGCCKAEDSYTDASTALLRFSKIWTPWARDS